MLRTLTRRSIRLIVVVATLAANAGGDSLPLVVLAAPDQHVAVGDGVRLGAFATGTSTGPWSVEVDWGDFTQDAFQVTAAGDLGVRLHDYATWGAYRVTLTVNDSNDAFITDSDTLTVFYGDAPAIRLFASDVIVDEGPEAKLGLTIHGLDPSRTTLRATTGRLTRVAGRSTTPTYETNGQSPLPARESVAADIDGDFDLDLITLTDKAYVWINRGDGGFEPHARTYGRTGSCTVNNSFLNVGDFDGDGTIDFTIATCTAYLQVWLNTGLGYFEIGSGSIRWDGARTVRPSVADLDGDGDLDMFRPTAVRIDDYGFRHGIHDVLLNRGDGTLLATEQPLVEQHVLGSAAGDIDADGDIDVVAPPYAYVNDGSAVFLAMPLPVEGSQRGVALGDLDGDGDLDLVTGSEIALNDGTGAFTIAQDFGPGSDAHGDLALGDLDDDGDLDVWRATRDPNRVWLNDVDGTFRRSPVLHAQLAEAVTLADFDADDRLDVFESGSDNRVRFARSGPQWHWSGPASDGPSASRAVTIDAFESDTLAASATFTLDVHNVPPTVEMHIPPIVCGEPLVLQFDPIEPSPEDRRSGLRITVSFEAFQETIQRRPGSRVSYQLRIPSYALPDRDVELRVDITDKDGGTRRLFGTLSGYCASGPGDD